MMDQTCQTTTTTAALPPFCFLLQERNVNGQDLERKRGTVALGVTHIFDLPAWSETIVRALSNHQKGKRARIECTGMKVFS